MTVTSKADLIISKVNSGQNEEFQKIMFFISSCSLKRRGFV